MDPKAATQLKDAKGNPVPLKDAKGNPIKSPLPQSPSKELPTPKAQPPPQKESPMKARVPEKLSSTIYQLNMETDTLVIVLTDQLNSLRQKLILAENQIIDYKSKGLTAEGLVGKLKRDIQNLTDQNAQLMKEVQDVTAKKDKIEQ